MATYLAITESSTDPDAPLTSELAKAWTSNLLAVAEGSTGAPKVNGLALDMYLGTYSGTGEGGEDTLVDIPNIGGVGLLMVNCMAQNTLLNGGVLGYRTSNDGGSSFSAFTPLIDASDPSKEYRTTVIDVSGGINFITFRLDAASSSEMTGEVEVLVIGRNGA